MITNSLPHAGEEIKRMETTMTKFAATLLILIAFALAVEDAQADSKKTPDDTARLKELDAYWAEVSRAVNAGDFKGYSATCHPEGVLV